MSCTATGLYWSTGVKPCTGLLKLVAPLSQEWQRVQAIVTQDGNVKIEKTIRLNNSADYAYLFKEARGGSPESS